MYKKTSRNVEPIVLFILIVITIMEFLIYVGGVATGNILLALNSMISLMVFGASLMIVTILIRIYELFIYFTDQYFSTSESAKSTKKNNKKTKSSSRKSRKGRK